MREQHKENHKQLKPQNMGQLLSLNQARWLKIVLKLCPDPSLTMS